MTNSATTPNKTVLTAAHLGELTTIIPPDMIDAALADTFGRHHRRRRLPSPQVIYLLLTGVLFADLGWRQVYNRLTASWVQPPTPPAASSISQAMRRVGPAPLRNLFDLLSGPATTTDESIDRFAGRLVVAVDGTQIPVADTDANQRAFPKPRSGINGQAGYPMIRIVALVATGTRSIINAVCGSDKISELAYTHQLIASLLPGMLLLGDRHFATRELYAAIMNQGADFLIRAKIGTRALKMPVEQRLADGSYLTVINGCLLRVIDARITITTDNGSRVSSYRLVTSMIDPAQATAKALVELYHQRWEVEVCYLELKSTLLDGRVLRGRYPQAVEQEVWAVLVLYQAVRIAMADSVLTVGVPPLRLSFSVAVSAARDQVVLGFTGSDERGVVGFVGRIGLRLLEQVMPKRRVRTRIRVVKRAMSRYPAKGRDVDRRTYPATVDTEVLTTSPPP